MLKKYVSFALTILLLNLSLGMTTFAETKEEKEAKLTQKIKAGIAKLGSGKETRVEVKLKDGRKIKGYISQINDESFVVNDLKTGYETTIPYPQTKQVKGNNLNTAAKIAIGVGIGVGGTLLFLYLLYLANDNS